MSDTERLNALCANTTRANVLNALHACRPNHPLGRGNAYKWRNAYSLVQQKQVDFLTADIDWLHDKALDESGHGLPMAIA